MTRALLLLPILLVLACGGTTEDGPAGEVSAPPPAVCTEASPSAARLEFPEGEIGALAVANGELFVGARSLGVDEDEKGALWRVAFDGRPTRQVSSGYVGGPLRVVGSTLLYAEPTGPEANGHIVITSLDGSRRVVEGPPLILGEFDVVHDRAFFFARGDGESAIALWSYDSLDSNAKVVRVADATGGGLFSNGDDLLQGTTDGADGTAPKTAVIRRFDKDRDIFVDITSFPIFERTVIGADARELYLHDARTRALVTVDLFSGKETRRLGADLDGSGGAYLTDDAVFVFQPSTRELVRVDKTTGARTSIASLPETTWIPAFASDACYVYAAVDGFRAIQRFPKR